MSQTVFILGAGASQEAGGPLMNGFLDAAEQIWKDKQPNKPTASFDLVFKALGSLNAAHAKAALDTNHLEEVFGACEMGKLTGRLADLHPEEIEELGVAFRRVIVTTLDRSISFPIEQGRLMPPEPYTRFGRLVSKLNEAGFGPVSFITFNYDMAIDALLFSQRERVDYCFGTPEANHVPLMKLHGSVNWARCTKCKRVAPWTLNEFFSKRSWSPHLQFEKAPRVRLDMTLDQFKHCEVECSPEAVIVPPTWNKAQYQEIVSVWQHAARHLSEAENIVIVGYSLPSADQFFRYLYAVGTISGARIKRFRVVDPSDEPESRFRALLGPTARERFKRMPQRFSQAIDLLYYEFGIAPP